MTRTMLRDKILNLAGKEATTSRDKQILWEVAHANGLRSSQIVALATAIAAILIEEGVVDGS